MTRRDYSVLGPGDADTHPPCGRPNIACCCNAPNLTIDEMAQVLRDAMDGDAA